MDDKYIKSFDLCCRCVAKRQRFAPAALYRPFGEQAAGVRSLSQFQALQEGEQELVSLRELGLTDAEIQLWLKRETAEQDEKVEARLSIRSDESYHISLTVAENIYIPAHTGQLPVQSCGADVCLVCVQPFLNVFV